ncbi:MAG: recombinase family protein [Oscillospiraceae bacterium]|nr:recombinase family protein [Oscillospiraceae bacterium]
MGALAIYLRISQDDDNVNESNSISNQRDLIHSYIAADSAFSDCEVLEFADDGWSGMNFERPKVQELLELAKRGKIQTIIVKDLSRWGRNYAEVNEHLDKIFPFLGIRFISINDNYDSMDFKGQTAPLDVAFSSLMHDIYVRELSEKVRQSHRAKALRGEYFCGMAPFGYIRSKTEKNKLVVDEVAALIIRRIFDMACEGKSNSKIAAVLNSEGTDSIGAYRVKSGRSYVGRKPANGKSYWSDSQISFLLKDERYTGTMVSCKTTVALPSSKQIIKIPESEWVRVPDTHEAIIPKEQFADVQKRFNKTTNSKNPKYANLNRPKYIPSPFKGRIFCGHCERSMQVDRWGGKYHFCDSQRLKREQDCNSDKTYIADLKAIVLSAVKVEAQKVFDNNRKRKATAAQSNSEKEMVLSEYKGLLSRISQLERCKTALYEKFADDKLEKDRYIKAKADLSKELSDAQARLADLNSRLQGFEGQMVEYDNEPLLQSILVAEELTDEMLFPVERIVVYAPDRIELQFAFGDLNI